MKLECMLLAGLLSIASLGPAQSNADTITIVGAVAKPGTYTVQVGVTLLKILARSGGFDKTANKKAVQILRAPQEIVVNVDALYQKKLPDIELQPGDIVVVPVRSNVKSPNQPQPFFDDTPEPIRNTVPRRASRVAVVPGA